MNKVIFITNFLGNGGAARVMSVVANYFVDKDVEVEICSFLDWKEKYKINDNIKYNIINCKSKNKILSKIERICKLRKILKNSKGATIISFEYFVNMQTIIANMFLKNKLIISERNDPARTGSRRLVKQLRNILYKFPNCLVCQTPEAKAYFSKKIQDKTVIIPNPIMPNLPKRYEGERKKEIVTFCRIEKQKNLPMMVDAFEMVNKEFPEYKLIIYGNGAAKEDLKRYIEQKELTSAIELKDFTQDIHGKIIDSAMFVSSSDYEGISNSMIEAMGIGLPTIVTNCPCGGARMMIKNNENGILVPVGDAFEMYKAIISVIKDKELSNKLSLNAVKINEKLNREKICKMWMELVRN